MAKKSKLSNPFLGLWHFVSMSAWDEDYLNERGPSVHRVRRKRAVARFSLAMFRGSSTTAWPTETVAEL